MGTKSSNSVGKIEGLLPWLKENLSFFLTSLKGFGTKEAELAGLLKEIDGYASRYRLVTGRELAEASILEIGYGARPNRLIALISLGYDARGIDLDQPVLKGSLAEFVKIRRKNGFKRLLKSLIRHMFFDGHERSSLDRVLQRRGCRLNIDESRFLVGDVSTFEFPRGSIDFVFSEDVFEHLPPDTIHAACKNLSNALSTAGLAIISPAVYAGIAGGHLVEWYPHMLGSHIERDSEPWEHLRKRRYHADCYLNELRVHDYEEIFGNYFDVVEVLNVNSGLGKEYLTDQIRQELAGYSEAELLSNRWTFVLRKKQ